MSDFTSWLKVSRISACVFAVLLVSPLYGEETVSRAGDAQGEAQQVEEEKPDRVVTPEQRAAVLADIRAAARERITDLAENGAKVKLPVFGRVAEVDVEAAGEDGIEGEYDGELVEISWDEIDDLVLGNLLLQLTGGAHEGAPLDVLRAGILLRAGGETENGTGVMAAAFAGAQAAGEEGKAVLEKMQALKNAMYGEKWKLELGGGGGGNPDALPAATSKVAADSVSTFHCISLYWSPEKGGAEKQVKVKFRKVPGGKWRKGLPMRYKPIPVPECKADYRGSIVNLTPGTNYEIVLELEGAGERTVLKATTWPDEFPVASVVKGSNMNSTLTISGAGRPDGYTLYDGTGCTIDTGNKSPNGILVNADYVIVRGYTVKNVSESAIRIGGGHHNIVIEKCDISKWGSPDKTGFGRDYQGGVYCNRSDVHTVIIQRNKIHSPNTDSNSWAEKHTTFHPQGPQTIVFWESTGNHVIRYNELWSDKDHYYNDNMGGGKNGSYTGFPGADSDIYCNYIANCWDDGIEVEGGGQNVRIWNNYIENVYLPIGNAANSIGPLYIWRNVSGKCYSLPGSRWGDHNGFLKMGYADSEKWMTGHFYVFNNTIFQPDGKGAAGLGGSGKPIKHCTTRNNILQVRQGDPRSIATNDHHVDNDFNYDLLSSRYPPGQESHGIGSIPYYVAGAGFDFETKTGNFQLAPKSRGYNEGVIIPNFCDWYKGKAPDMGAHEAGTPNMRYGVEAEFIPPGADD